ncbi:peptide N-acetyl-beta-D-glucosaminyl asparaginase amidase A-domain-containing protein, partial [Jimgerdemannia flammicorona]
MHFLAALTAFLLPAACLADPNISVNPGSIKLGARLAGHLHRPPSFAVVPHNLQKVSHPFEVDVPLKVPRTKACTVNVVQHEFVFSFGKPFVGNFTPPVEKECNGPWEMVVLEMTGSSRGRQYDRIAGLWIGGFLRTSTPEPTNAGILWKFQKDVTSYSSTLTVPQTVVMDLSNLVTAELNGTYTVTVDLAFYSADAHANLDDVPDLVVPISAGAESSAWFSLQSDSSVGARNVTLPRNLRRAVVEVYANGQINDEFWYVNAPNSYIQLLNQTGTGNGAYWRWRWSREDFVFGMLTRLSSVPTYPGPYREILVFIDNKLAGATVTFPVIFSGERASVMVPMLSIGALNIPSYYIDVTPFVGLLVDGKRHQIGLQ